VRVEEVHPQEEGLVLRALRPIREPRECAVHGAGRRTLADHEELGLVLGPEIVVIDIEALVQPVAASEHGRRHEGTRPISRRP
jgi:hypothetical protein